MATTVCARPATRVSGARWTSTSATATPAGTVPRVATDTRHTTVSVPRGSQGSTARYAVTRHQSVMQGARCSSVVRAFAHGAKCRRIDPS